MWKVLFDLTIPSNIEAYSEINGIKVSISPDCNQIVVENIDAFDEADIQQKALTVANQFLNNLWKYDAYLYIKPDSGCLERTNAGGISIAPAPASCVVSTGSVKLVISDGGGKITDVYDSSKLGKIEVTLSDAASYYRHAQSINDPFYKFHDLYLVAENIASKIRDEKGLIKIEVEKFSESQHSYEEGLLRLALDECFGGDSHNLKQVAIKMPEFDNAKQTTAQVVKILHRAYRCQINHSKASTDKKIPFNPEDEKNIKTALPLMDFVARSLLQYEDNLL